MLRALLDHLARLFSPAKPKEPPAPAPDEAEDDEPLPDPDAIAVLPIEDAIDLHGFAPRDIPSVVEEYLHEAHARGFPEVRLIHGRGKGVQRRVVQSILARHPLVESFRDAPATRGGWGATIARLRVNRS
ncbi:Smr/MutS family protein [Polyangium jinanense]|uniref:Smr/MutS family protein n=1 Tax=Polyangium jinanense TaxID=2829994 RepID=A0A9X3X2V8_9BACT|nr:Smr/MutS family protein [Polyangium jinanense]MDC3952807.1 Smr/MutS family protein [Polyangium jinanense]MDC3980426.1 Smr/MutS family protein [Polyangium jinanense]